MDVVCPFTVAVCCCACWACCCSCICWLYIFWALGFSPALASWIAADAWDPISCLGHADMKVPSKRYLPWS